jgi:hypothetical protein
MVATNRTTDQVLFSPEIMAANRSQFGMRQVTDVWRNQHVIIPRAEMLYALGLHHTLKQTLTSQFPSQLARRKGVHRTITFYLRQWCSRKTWPDPCS